ncbi:MurR/RpiR family transcriptional regulator [Desertimonas flava]|jgi:DNA-binding MurR/RpiR family transcriptional regulator|uniref:MurR/RpiR family transcriptional regulator n=1 Tax=Desertimonas flava TaxID=2064846 RepID=UPI0013C51523|nr:MurR/RpiR family transcriptional regulator [Desertimonas flava]
MADMEVTDRIGAAGPQLTTAERRVAQVILELPQLVAFGTVADLAAQAKAGAATVVRLAAKLGFDGFSALQSSVQRDLSRQLRPAVERIRELDGHQPLERHAAVVLSNVQATLAAVDRATLDKTVELLADLDRPVLVLAGDAERGVALQFVHDLTGLRADVDPVWGTDVAVRRQLAVSAPQSTLLVLDLRRYERWLLDGVAVARELGHTVVALSDGPLSPLAMAAHYSFTLAAQSMSPFESQVGTLALLELITASVAERIRDSAESRLARVDAAWAAGGSLTDG